MEPAEVWPPPPQQGRPTPREAPLLGNWRCYLGVGLAALDWAIALCWPQAYRSWFLYRRLVPWEDLTVIYMMVASPVGFVLSLLGAKGPGRWAVRLSVLGAVLNVFPFFVFPFFVFPFFVFGFGCRGMDPTGF